MKMGPKSKTNLDSLVPDECFTVETMSDGSKNYNCKQCNKTFKKEISIKQHIGSNHKNQSKKRTIGKRDVEMGRTKKKPNLLEEYDFDVPDEQSTKIDFENDDDLDTTHDIDQYCAINLTKSKTIDTEVVFTLNESVERIIAGNDDTLQESMNQDQDHNDLSKEISDDVNLLRAKVLSLEVELKAKEVQLTGKESDLLNVQLENSRMSNEIENLVNECKIKDESNDIMTAKVNTLEETKKSYEGKLRTYGQMIKKLNNELKELKTKGPGDTTEEVKKLKAQMKQKDKKISENQNDLKSFVDKLAALENQVKGTEDNATGKYKNVTNELNEKKKDLKKTKDDLDNANKRVGEFQGTMNQKNSKICELEATITRLQLMYDHVKELKSKNASNDEQQEDNLKHVDSGSKVSPKKKCSFENSGNCRKSNCSYLHPKKTCQAHSKYGSCPSESICEHRHPSGICYHLQHGGFCHEGEKCRMRHPVEFGPNFLGQNLPSPHFGSNAPGARGGMNNQQQEDNSQQPRRRDSWGESNMYPGQHRGRGANRGLGNQF